MYDQYRREEHNIFHRVITRKICQGTSFILNVVLKIINVVLKIVVKTYKKLLSRQRATIVAKY